MRGVQVRPSDMRVVLRCIALHVAPSVSRRLKSLAARVPKLTFTAAGFLSSEKQTV